MATMSSWLLISMPRPSETSLWSSTTRTLIGAAAFPTRRSVVSCFTGWRAAPPRARGMAGLRQLGPPLPVTRIQLVHNRRDLQPVVITRDQEPLAIGAQPAADLLQALDPVHVDGR